MTSYTATLTLAAALLLAGCTATEKKPERAATEEASPGADDEAAVPLPAPPETGETIPTGPSDEPAMTDETPPSFDDESLEVPPELEAAGFETTYGEVETFTATLKIDPTVGSKAFQGVSLAVEDGRLFLVAYRPDDHWRSFEDKRVSVTGRPYTPGALTQHIMADHFEVQTIDEVSIDAPSWTGDTETIEGELVEEPMGPPGSKLADELTHWLVLDDGARLFISGADDGLVGKRVAATGRRWKPSPYVAHVGAVHFDADAVVAAETP